MATIDALKLKGYTLPDTLDGCKASVNLPRLEVWASGLCDDHVGVLRDHFVALEFYEGAEVCQQLLRGRASLPSAGSTQEVTE